MGKWVAIIPAKGHSDAVSRKNLQDVGGMPLFWHSVRYARAEGMEVVVSTDDPEIRQYAQERGCRVVDEQVNDSCLIHCVRQVMNQVEAERYVLLQPTSPIREPGLLARIMRMDAECAVTVSKVKIHGYIDDRWLTQSRRQDALHWLWQFDGSVLTGTRAMANAGVIFTAHPTMVEQDMPYTLQVDSWSQLQVIRAIYDRLHCR